MIKPDLFRRLLLTALALFCWTSTVSAQLPLPAGTTLPYQSVGKIDSFDVGSGSIVIGDVGYQLAPNVVVRSADGKLVTPGVLGKGLKVGISTRDAGRRTVITEIWIVSGR